MAYNDLLKIRTWSLDGKQTSHITATGKRIHLRKSGVKKWKP